MYVQRDQCINELITLDCICINGLSLISISEAEIMGVFLS